MNLEERKYRLKEHFRYIEMLCESLAEGTLGECYDELQLIELATDIYLEELEKAASEKSLDSDASRDLKLVWSAHNK